MADNKQYYYMRLKDNFFDSDNIKLLESVPNDGYKFTNILLKMYLKSLKNNGSLMFNGRIPFNTEMLSVVTGHSIGDVVRAIEMFKEFGLIEILDSGEIYMMNIQEFIGKTTTEADRKRAYRKEIDDKKGIGTNVRQNSDKTIPEIELEIEKELNKEIETEPETENNPASGYSKIIKLLEENGFGLIGGIVAQNVSDELKDFAEKSDLDNATAILEKAIQISVLNGVTNFKYVLAITKKWYDKKLFTISDVEASENKHSQNKQVKPLDQDMSKMTREEQLIAVMGKDGVRF
ncbi:phage replisome organizer N-terminal domain-containing protein [Leuconostoc gelidum subsp. gasicomitatum]|uniref:phage replisome organizer N-terminal domain-containing protein n=1 Tax=Leuconostoc gasicomitatum TaxID=115778 RepID=UPI001CC586ED|nr:phage replisome organizer N-terminal domain-containing protein [Leuconostoc gasicomitatum]MBZ5995387.1 phage replisome organizer N-terminal domain-containing protein [Leuconostoc gasicomitatum]